jgi:hypothetical protein
LRTSFLFFFLCHSSAWISFATRTERNTDRSFLLLWVSVFVSICGGLLRFCSSPLLIPQPGYPWPHGQNGTRTDLFLLLGVCVCFRLWGSSALLLASRQDAKPPGFLISALLSFFFLFFLRSQRLCGESAMASPEPHQHNCRLRSLPRAPLLEIESRTSEFHVSPVTIRVLAPGFGAESFERSANL